MTNSKFAQVCADKDKQLSELVARARKAEQERDALAIRCSDQENAIRNQRGGDLCWMQNPENMQVAKVMPAEEFLESCRRFHTQMVAERGIFTAGRTIAQLEADNETLKAELKRLGDDKDYVFRANIVNEWEERLESWQQIAQLRKQERDKARQDSAKLLEALRGVVSLSDRKHNAWDKAHALIDAAKEPK